MPTRNRYRRFKVRNNALRPQDVQVSAAAVEARTDLDKFIKFVGSLDVGCEYHKVWASKWVTKKSNHLLSEIAGENLNILAPRGSAKSTRLAYFVAWAIGHNPGIPILYLSYSAPIALGRSSIIKRIIERPEYREVFPHIRPNKSKWSDTQWEIDKPYAGVSELDHDYTLYAAGLTGAIVSKRSWLIVVDDPIKNRTSILNPDVREKISSNWRTAVLPTLIPGGRILGLGTRFLKNDIHQTDICPLMGIKQLEQSAIVTNDQGQESSYWEELYPYRTKKVNLGEGQNVEIRGLYEKREDDWETFSFQMQNKIVSQADVVIEDSWIQWTEDIPYIHELDEIAIGLDLAARQRERYDFSAITMIGRKGGNFYVLDGIQGRWPGNIDKIDRICEMAYDWLLLGGIEDPETEEMRWVEKPEHYILIHAEETNYQASLQSDWKRVMEQDRGIYSIRCIPAYAKGDKLSRLKSCTGLLQQKRIFFNSFRKKRLEKLSTQLTEFGFTTHDDFADSFVYGLLGLLKRSADITTEG